MQDASPDFIPDGQFQPDQAPSAAEPSAPTAPTATATPTPNSPDFIPDGQFQSDEAKQEQYSSPLQKAQAFEEGLERGLTGGISDVWRTKVEPLFLPQSLQSDPNAMKAREDVNPLTSGAGDMIGSTASLIAANAVGLGAAKDASLWAHMASNAAQSAVLSGTHAVTQDLAFGPPNLTASKIFADGALSALLGGTIGGITTGVIGGAASGIKNVAGKVMQFGTPDLTVDPSTLSPLEKVRMGLFAGMTSPEGQEAIAKKTVEGLNSLTKMMNADNLSALASDPHSPALQEFNSARTEFFKAFGDKSGQLSPDEMMKFITKPSSKSQTVAFNNFLRAARGLSDVPFADENVSNALRDAQQNLQTWLGELPYSNQTQPHVDIEYGGPGVGDVNGQPTPYSTKFGVPPGEEITPNFSEGVTLPDQSRVGSFGNEGVSPYDNNFGFSLKQIHSKIRQFQDEVVSLLEKQNEGLPVNSEEVQESVGDTSKLGNQALNLQQANEAIQSAPKPLPLLQHARDFALYTGQGKLLGVTQLISAIRNVAGEGGLYRLGNSIATPAKILNGIGDVAQKMDEKMGDKARLIFTGLSGQARTSSEGADQSE